MTRGLVLLAVMVHLTAFAAPPPGQVASPMEREPPDGWVDLRDVVPGIRLDIRYHTADNFTGAPLPGYGAPGAWLLAKPAQALAAVQQVHRMPSANAFALLFSDRGIGAEAKAKKQAAEAMESASTSVWSRGDPLEVERRKQAEAREAQALLATLGSEQLRATRVHTLRQALYATRPHRAVGVNVRGKRRRGTPARRV